MKRNNTERACEGYVDGRGAGRGTVPANAARDDGYMLGVGAAVREMPKHRADFAVRIFERLGFDGSLIRRLAESRACAMLADTFAAARAFAGRAPKKALGILERIFPLGTAVIGLTVSDVVNSIPKRRAREMLGAALLAAVLSVSPAGMSESALSLGHNMDVGMSEHAAVMSPSSAYELVMGKIDAIKREASAQYGEMVVGAAREDARRNFEYFMENPSARVFFDDFVKAATDHIRIRRDETREELWGSMAALHAILGGGDKAAVENAVSKTGVRPDEITDAFRLDEDLGRIADVMNVDRDAFVRACGEVGPSGPFFPEM